VACFGEPLGKLLCLARDLHQLRDGVLLRVMLPRPVALRVISGR
jgi:hypothetical protein